MRIAAVVAGTFLVAGSAVAGIWDDEDGCRYTANRNAASSAAGITKVVIHGESGSLKVDGVAGATQVAATGKACTSDDDFLDRMTLTMRKQGSELHITAEIPDKTVIFGFFHARLDIGVTLPAGMAVTIDDDSGWTKVANTGPTIIDDDSGAIEVRNVRGNLVIQDDSGAIDVDGVTGNVEIEDDSGEIVVKNVGGNVEIEDDSGSLTVTRVQGSVRISDDDSGSILVEHVKRDVTVDSDGSGGIEVADVGGNFRVGHKGSGGIEYVRVAGRVDIPERKRR